MSPHKLIKICGVIIEGANLEMNLKNLLKKISIYYMLQGTFNLIINRVGNTFGNSLLRIVTCDIVAVNAPTLTKQ